MLSRRPACTVWQASPPIPSGGDDGTPIRPERALDAERASRPTGHGACTGAQPSGTSQTRRAQSPAPETQGQAEGEEAYGQAEGQGQDEGEKGRGEGEGQEGQGPRQGAAAPLGVEERHGFAGALRWGVWGAMSGSPMLLVEDAQPEQRRRIDARRADVDAEVEVGTRRAARRADGPDHLTSLDTLAVGHRDRVEVEIEGI